MKEATFYFDFVSSNVYLAWTQLGKLCDDHKLRIKPVPVLFAGLLNSHANVGPAEIPAKRLWMLKNTLRKAAMLDVPLNPPLHHPFNPLLALRACCVDMDDKDLFALITALLNAVWVESRHISDEQVMIDIAKNIGLDGKDLVNATRDPIIKNRLKTHTENAVNKRVFGIPSIIVGDELFFGFDDFPFLDQYLRGKDSVGPSSMDAWQLDKMPASSQRPGQAPTKSD